MDFHRKLLSEYNFVDKYARYNPTEKRRETWDESIQRVMKMHREHLGELTGELEDELFDIEQALLQKRILGSQRSLQFGGQAVLDKHARSYNCSSCYVDHPNKFGEALYLLLCGVGVGYSVQDHHVSQLPAVNDSQTMIHRDHYQWVIADTIEGWASAFKILMNAYMGTGFIPSFDYSEIRPKNAPIKSCGGKAPSAYPLRVALQLTEQVLIKRAGQKLKPSDASDIMCILADCVLAGGVRRSALLCMFSVDTDDTEMIEYKSKHEWWVTHPYRARANISALVLRDDPLAETHFNRIFEFTQKYGEPAVIWSDSTEFVYNPCVEIGMCPMLIKDADGDVIRDYTADLIDPKNRAEWIAQGYTFETAFQFCNLCEINASLFVDYDDAVDAVRLATILGCIQASYTGTEGDYLSNTVTRAILERESLLGVSLTGLASASNWVRESETLELLSEIATTTAREYWQKCGLLSEPARVTCVKPSGNASVLLGCASGVHHEHSKRYIRRVQTPKNSPIAQKFMEINPHAVENSVWSSLGDDVCLSFAIEAPNDALFRPDHSANEFLDWVARVQRSWVRRGTLRPLSVEGLTHNVSNTCTVNPDEWEEVANQLSRGRAVFGGVSCLSASGDYDYPQAPYQQIYEPHEIEDDDPHRDAKLDAWAQWNLLRTESKHVDYTTVIEEEDNTTVMLEPACAGGACEI